MRCSFCKKNIEKGTATMFVKKTGKIHYFCSSKCEKNQLKLGRKPLTTRWTEEFIKEKKVDKK